MNYNEAINYIGKIPKFCYPLGNEQLTGLLSLMGNPEKKLRFIHIVGTNGKGSAAAMLGEILKRAGYRTGVFTSPYIRRFNERIAANGAPIADGELADEVGYAAELCEKNGISVSQFAFILACALHYYEKIGCDAVVLEAGMGGRLDATNVITESLVTMIMSVGLDHTEYLGDTKEKIAAEKCGVIKPGGTVVAAENSPEVMRVIADFCARRGARLVCAPKAAKTPDGFAAVGTEYRLSLAGEFQAQNAAAVLAAVGALREKGMQIPESAVCEGFAGCRHSARFERAEERLIVDGAHNPDGIRALCRSLDKIAGRKVAVLAMMQDKAVGECVAALAASVDAAVVCALDMPRCMSAAELAKACAEKGFVCEPAPDVTAAIESARAAVGDGTVIVCGSLYLAGETLRILDKKISGG